MKDWYPVNVKCKGVVGKRSLYRYRLSSIFEGQLVAFFYHGFRVDQCWLLTEGRPERRAMVLSRKYRTQNTRFLSATSASERFQPLFGLLCMPFSRANRTATEQSIDSSCGKATPCTKVVWRCFEVSAGNPWDSKILP